MYRIKMQRFWFLCHCFEVPDVPWPLAVAAKYDEPFSVSSTAGSAYHGRASDTWAVGVTLYCMITGRYPFLGETLQETYDKIVNDPADIPSDVSPLLVDLLERLLCKDPRDRITLEATAAHPWVAGDEGPVPEYMCRCGFGRRKRNGSQEAVQ